MAPRAHWFSRSSSSKPKIDNDDLTYGVELEFVFAFHESELELGRTNGMQDKIIKNLPYLVRESDTFARISPTELPNHAYNSWGILPGGKKPIMPYGNEPQEIVGKILEQKCPQIDYTIYDTMKLRDKTTDKYYEWLICKDHSVCGVGSDKIFPGRLHFRVNHEAEGDWDSIGLEAVSRILATGTPEDIQEIAAIARAVKGDSSDHYGSFITNQCALHVHVQAPSGLDATRELAILLLIYEEEISRLHPPCRRPYSNKNEDGPRGSVDSNRIKILWDDASPMLPKRQMRMLDRSTKALKEAYSIPHLRQKMEKSFRSNESLARFMNYSPGTGENKDGNRNRIVNFTTAARGPAFSKTIEFRQARGSLDEEEISHWVKFCTGLVRLAKFYSQNHDLFPVKRWEDVYHEGHYLRSKVDVFDLMRDMELSDAEIQYWEQQVARYQTGTKGDQDDRTDNEMPPVDPPAQDSDSEGSADDIDRPEPPQDDNDYDDDEGGNPPGPRQGTKRPSYLYKIGENDLEDGFATSPDALQSGNAEVTVAQRPEVISIDSDSESPEDESDDEATDDQKEINQLLAEYEDSSLVGDEDTIDDEVIRRAAYRGERFDAKAGEASEGSVPEEPKNIDMDPDDYISGPKLYDNDYGHWEALPTLGSVGTHLNASAAHAIYDSLRYQYPNEIFTTRSKDIVLQEILSILDGFSGAVNRSHNILEVRDTLSSLFGHQYALVILRSPFGLKRSGRTFELISRVDRRRLYLGFTRIRGFTRWQTMKRMVINEPEEEESPRTDQEGSLSDLPDYEEIIAREAEQQKESQQEVQEDSLSNFTDPDPQPGEYQQRFLPNFDWNDWAYEPGEKHIIGHRRNVSAAHALYDSLESQYPGSEYVTDCDAKDVLSHLDKIIWNGSHHTKWNGARALKGWTNNEFQLVVVERHGDPTSGVYKAERISPGNSGKELFVKYTEQRGVRGTETIWQYMWKKKKKPGSKPSSPVKEQGVSKLASPTANMRSTRSSSKIQSPTVSRKREVDDSDLNALLLSERKKADKHELKIMSPTTSRKSSKEKEVAADEEEGVGGMKGSKTPSPTRVRKHIKDKQRGTNGNEEEEEAEEDPALASSPVKRRKSNRRKEKDTAENQGQPKSPKRRKHTVIYFPKDQIREALAALPVPPVAPRPSQLTSGRPSATPVGQSTHRAPGVERGPERKRKFDSGAMESPTAKKSRKSSENVMDDDEEEKEEEHMSPRTRRQVQQAIENSFESLKDYNTTVARAPTSAAQVAALVGDGLSQVRGSDIFTGARIAVEDMHNDDFTWRVTNFTIDDWDIEETSSWVQRRRNLCGVRALLQSMQAQYPSSPFARASINEVFNVFRTLARGEGQNADHLQNTLDRWTGNQFRLVVVEDEDRGVGREFAARRVGEHQDSFGANLYVYYTAPGVPNHGKRRNRYLGHWESMRRKPGVGERQ